MNEGNKNMTEKMENVGYSTIDEIINDIYQVLSLEYQETIKKMSNRWFLWYRTFNVGQWIRNNILSESPNSSSLLKNLSDPKEYMFLDDDNSSHDPDKLYEKVTTENK